MAYLRGWLPEYLNIQLVAKAILMATSNSAIVAVSRIERVMIFRKLFMAWFPWPVYNPCAGQQVLGLGRIHLDFFPEPSDVDHQGVFIAIEIIIPGGATEAVGGDDIALVFPELFQQGVLLGS